MGSQTSLHGPLAGGNSSQVYLALPVWEEENRNPDFHESVEISREISPFKDMNTTFIF